MPQNRPANSHNPTRIPLIFGIQLAVAAIWNLQKIFLIFFTFRVMTSVPSVNNSPISPKRTFREHPHPLPKIHGRKVTGTAKPHEQRKLVLRLGYDEFEAFRERCVNARGTIHAFYNDLSVEEEPPNSLQYKDRHDQSRAHNDKQQTENCDDKYPVASS